MAPDSETDESVTGTNATSTSSLLKLSIWKGEANDVDEKPQPGLAELVTVACSVAPEPLKELGERFSSASAPAFESHQSNSIPVTTAPPGSWGTAMNAKFEPA